MSTLDGRWMKKEAIRAIHWMRVCFTTTACSFVRFQIVIFIDWSTFSRRCTRHEWQRQWFYYLSNAKISQNACDVKVFLLISGTDTVDWRQRRCLTLMAMCVLIVAISLARSSVTPSPLFCRPLLLPMRTIYSFLANLAKRKRATLEILLHRKGGIRWRAKEGKITKNWQKDDRTNGGKMANENQSRTVPTYLLSLSLRFLLAQIY